MILPLRGHLKIPREIFDCCGLWGMDRIARGEKLWIHRDAVNSREAQDSPQQTVNSAKADKYSLKPNSLISSF